MVGKRKPGIVAAGLYLAIEASLFVFACLHPSGLGYEFVPFAFLAFPWYGIFGAALVRVIGDLGVIADFGCMIAGTLANAIAIYWACAGLARIRSIILRA